MNIFISTYSDKKSIYKCKVNRKGKISILKYIEMNAYPSYLYRKNFRIGIALKKDENNDEAGIAIWNKNLECIYKYNNQNSYTHIFIDNKYIIAGSYHNGNILIINKKDIKRNIVINYKNSKIHNVGKIKKNLYYAIDTENSIIYFYTINDTKYELKATFNLRKGDRPRHLVAYRNHIYVLCEGISKIINIEYKNNNFVKQQEITTLNKNNNISNMPSAIRRFKNYIFISNRGENTINIYKIKGNGELEKITYFDVKGKTPRDFNIINNGKHIVVGNEDTNEVVIFKIDYKKEEVTYVSKIKIERPVCIEK